MNRQFGPVTRLGPYRWRQVYRNDRFIGFVWQERRRWTAALPEPPGIYPFVTDADGRVIWWRNRDGAVLALHMLAEGIAL